MNPLLFKADLHCHTNCSDGTVSPTDILYLAKEKGLQGLSITDHDTISAYKEALPIAQALQFPLVTGVEFSASHNNKSIHLLGYSFTPGSSDILELCERHHERRAERNGKILELLTQKGMPIYPEDLPMVSETHSFGRPHIALAMIKKGYVQSIQEAFHDYIGEGKPCFAVGKTISVEETIEIIHKARGFAVIAHPHLINDASIFNDMLKMNFDGIEGYYAQFPPSAHQRWVKAGEKRGWLITGGSDFHGAVKPAIQLGSSWAPQETFKHLMDRFLENVSNAH